MKLFKSLLLVAAIAGLFTSCSDEGYWDAYNTKSTTTYSFMQKSNNFNLGATDTLPDIKVTVNRNTNRGNVTLPLNVQFNSNIMSVDSANIMPKDTADITSQDNVVVIFNEGEYTADLIINVDEARIQKGFNYEAKVSFLVDSLNFFEHNYSISGNKSFTLTFVQNYTWIPVGNVKYTEALVSAFYGVQNLTYSVPAEQAKENHEYIRLIDPYGKAWPYNPNFSAVDNQKHYMTFNCAEDGVVYMDGIHYSGIEMSDGELRFMSMAYYYMQNGKSYEEVKADGYCGTLSEDLVITFPAGTILISEANYNGGAWYQSNKTGEFAVDLSTAELLE
ncbi:MAG: hypothetical protein IKJ97_01325 [Bacteroidaceae bacterium]|nr:hypothetical protein [Bacteroidaceae bacterium]